MAVYEIPLSPTPQRFSITLTGVEYNLTVKWNAAPDAGWAVDIADAFGAAIVSGVPLVTGADLLAQYAYLNFGGQLVVQTDHDTDAVPTFENLGETSHLFFLVTP